MKKRLFRSSGLWAVLTIIVMSATPAKADTYIRIGGPMPLIPPPLLWIGGYPPPPVVCSPVRPLCRKVCRPRCAARRPHPYRRGYRQGFRDGWRARHPRRWGGWRCR